MSALLSRPLLLALLGVLASGPPPAAHAQAAPPLSPTVTAKLRRLLPSPEATLDSKMEINFGLGYSLDQGFHFSRQSASYAPRIAAIRRQMTGGTADAAWYRQLGVLYQLAGLA